MFNGLLALMGTYSSKLKKTKPRCQPKITINDEVENVTHFNYLHSIIDNKLGTVHKSHEETC